MFKPSEKQYLPAHQGLVSKGKQQLHAGETRARRVHPQSPAITNKEEQGQRGLAATPPAVHGLHLTRALWVLLSRPAPLPQRPCEGRSPGSLVRRLVETSLRPHRRPRARDSRQTRAMQD